MYKNLIEKKSITMPSPPSPSPTHPFPPAADDESTRECLCVCINTHTLDRRVSGRIINSNYGGCKISVKVLRGAVLTYIYINLNVYTYTTTRYELTTSEKK